MKKKTYNNLIGKRFGSIVVLGINEEESKNKKRCILNIECDCGKIKCVRASDVESGEVMSCGNRKIHKIQYYDDIEGQKFGKLTAIKYTSTINKHAYWLCECECGNYCVVQSSNLKTKHTTSCGCNKITNTNGTFLKHLRNILKPKVLKKIEDADYTCEISNKKCEVQVHHIISFKDLYEKTLRDLNIDFRKELKEYNIEEIKKIDDYFLKLNSENILIVISTELHVSFHKKYGYKDFKKEDFDEFINNIK